MQNRFTILWKTWQLQVSTKNEEKSPVTLTPRGNTANSLVFLASFRLFEFVFLNLQICMIFIKCLQKWSQAGNFYWSPFEHLCPELLVGGGLGSTACSWLHPHSQSLVCSGLQVQWPLGPSGWSCWAPSLCTPKASSGPHPTPAWWSAPLSFPCPGFLGAPCYSFPQRLPLDSWLIFPPSPFLLILVSANGFRFLPKLQGPLGRLPPLILTALPLLHITAPLTSLHPALTLALSLSVSLFHHLLPSCCQRLFLGPLPPAHPSYGSQRGFV